MKRVSKHISRKEAIFSPTAIRKGITNEPTAKQWECMSKVANRCFEPAREHFGKPIYINSFFRCVTLNKAIGGSGSSDHINGMAIDMDTRGQKDFTNLELFHWLRLNVDFDQLIYEYGNEQEPDWVHISYRSEKENRKQVLKAFRKEGKTAYEFMTFED